ncbi:Copia protein [Eumeta japonica]|uniref:Copia protein n=1 Tax=Eumeta variegata TaxID=151549 RepID=A0A4C1X717_EUMVA|nr:Copia protein [Eumeta japonica]
MKLRILLSELDVIDVIDKEIPTEPNTEWCKKDKIAKSTIVEYLSDSFLGFIKNEYNSKQIFENLDAIYERKSLATQLALRKKLLSLKLQNETPLIKHFHYFEDLLSELLAAGAKLEEMDKVSHLLLTLPNSYDGVITALETLAEDNLTLAFVKTRLLDQEIKLLNESRDTSLKVLQVEVSNNRQNNSKKPRRLYRNYGNFSKAKVLRSKITKIKCHYCGRKGHIKNDCYYYKGREQQGKYNSRKRMIQTVQISEPTHSTDFSGFAFMAGGLSENNEISNKISFILDSGASDHIINREDLTHNFTDLDKPLMISIAKNGVSITATKKGTLKVRSGLGVNGTLQDVLYCPDVPYNLLSSLSLKRLQSYSRVNGKRPDLRSAARVVRGTWPPPVVRLLPPTIPFSRRGPSEACPCTIAHVLKVWPVPKLLITLTASPRWMATERGLEKIRPKTGPPPLSFSLPPKSLMKDFAFFPKSQLLQKAKGIKQACVCDNAVAYHPSDQDQEVQTFTKRWQRLAPAG